MTQPLPLVLSAFSHCLAPRPRASHKGDFGHVLIMGGDVGYAGAVRMAAEAALRVGAGLVSVATHPAHAVTVNLTRPEIMAHAVVRPRDLLPLLAKATVIVAGPGLGRSRWGRMMWKVIRAIVQPMVLDADGLNWLAEFPLHRNDWILTPHVGEAARLLQKTTAAIQQMREASVVALQQRYGGVAILKGAGTLVATAAGEVAICQAGNPGMASGGMGDVLSGVLGGLLAQRISLENTAKLGVLLHATAGDRAAAAGGERGLLATDLLVFLRKLVNQG